MTATLLQFLGILLVIVLFAAVLLRPAGVLTMVLAVGIVVAAIVVTWNQVENYRAQKALGAPLPEAAAGVTVPPPAYPRAGS